MIGYLVLLIFRIGHPCKQQEITATLQHVGTQNRETLRTEVPMQSEVAETFAEGWCIPWDVNMLDVNPWIADVRLRSNCQLVRLL